MKVFGETLKPDIPYKTLLMSNQDTAAFAVKETLEKYGLPTEDPINYCLVQVISPTREDRDLRGAHTKEFILEDEACPLAILMQHPPAHGSIIFQIRKCPQELIERRKNKKNLTLKQNQPQASKKANQDIQYHQQPQQLASQQQQQPQINAPTRQPNDQSIHKYPFLVEVKTDQNEGMSPKVYFIRTDVCEIGNNKPDKVAKTQVDHVINIGAQGVQPKHCLIRTNNSNSARSIIPFHETYVNGQLIREETILHSNFVIGIGRYALFRYIDTNLEPFINKPMSPPVATKQQQQHTHKIDPNSNKQHQLQSAANYGVLFDDMHLGDKPLKDDFIMPSLNKPEANGIPGLVEFHDDVEDELLLQLSNTNPTTCQFKLAPVYTMYMMLRYVLSKKYHLNNLGMNEKLEKTILIVHKIIGMIRDLVEKNRFNKILLAFWLANTSELLFFIKQDQHLNQVNYDAQEILADCIQIMFRYLVQIIRNNLESALSAFIDPSDHVEDVQFDSGLNENLDAQSEANLKRPTLKHVIRILNDTMHLLRGFRVNAALTIQLFSQLFHFISVWLFNKLVLDNRSGLCSRYWGAKLSRRLSTIHIWAEKQGLELAADCHLAKINQAAFLLQTSKHDLQDLSAISSNCFALNSLQIKCILKNYMTAQGEQPLSYQLVNNLISIAQNTADDLIKSEGRSLQVKEEVDLQLPFLLPEDGHSCDMIKGLPVGLLEFLENLQNMGLCCLWQNSQVTGSWTEYMCDNNNTMLSKTEPNRTMQVKDDTINSTLSMPQQPQMSDTPSIVKINITKRNGGLGLSIVAAKPQNQPKTGIYIKSVVSGGAADLDGRLEAGDLLLAVDDVTLLGISQEKAAEILTKSGSVVSLTIAKNAAVYYGLDALLNKPTSPPMTPEYPKEIENSIQMQNQMGQPTRKPNSNEYESLANSRTLPFQKQNRSSLHEAHMHSQSHEMSDGVQSESMNGHGLPPPPLPHEIQTRFDFNPRASTHDKHVRQLPPPLELPLSSRPFVRDNHQASFQHQQLDPRVVMQSNMDKRFDGQTKGNQMIRQIPMEIIEKQPHYVSNEREDFRNRSLPQDFIMKSQAQGTPPEYTNKQNFHELNSRQSLNVYDQNQRYQQNMMTNATEIQTQQVYRDSDANNRFDIHTRQILQEVNNRPVQQTSSQNQDSGHSRMSTHYEMSNTTASDNLYQQNKQNIIEHKQMPQTERYIERDINLIDNFNKTLKIVGYQPLKDSYSNLSHVSPNKSATQQAPIVSTPTQNTNDEVEFNDQPTPSVIGAHEVYLDPRTKKLQAQKQRMLDLEDIEGEKLSFKDKMKLFDKELQEAQKLKASKKQRDIELKMN